jgi:superoxide dismutase, Fe-Mn family
MQAAAKYKIKDYSALLNLEGMSETLMQTHLDLYGGYVKACNEMLQKLDAHRLEPDSMRRLAWEFNGMRLHELYFDQLTPGGNDDDAERAQQMLRTSFGSPDAWEKEFRAIASMRGIGWACMVYDPQTKRLMNQWVNEHDAGLLAGTQPIVVLDVFEHAYIMDYGMDREPYLDAFMRNLDWSVPVRRLRAG